MSVSPINTEERVLAPDSPADRYAQAYRWMLLARVFEEKIRSLYRAGKIVGGVYLGRGQEAFSAALGMQLDRGLGDIYSGLIRDQAGKLAFGESLEDAARTYLGSVLGPMRGRDGNIHRGRPREGMPAMISHLGSNVPVVNGMLMAKRFHGETGAVGAVCAGDGATSTGAFHEGVNQAAVEKLPLVIAVADNQFAYSTPTSRQFACEDLVQRAEGYGIEGYSIDGTDLGQCLETFRRAIERARDGAGPQLVVGKLLRLSGHGEHDDASYVPDEVRAGRWGRDCLEVAKEQLREKKAATEEEIAALEPEIRQQVDKIVGQAQSEPGPNPAEDSWAALSTGTLSDGFLSDK